MRLVDAPPEFRSVTLRDRYTWHRVTLQEWMDTRKAIITRVRTAMPWEPTTPLYDRSLKRATELLWHREAREQRPTGVAIEGRLQVCLDQIMYEQFVLSAMHRGLLTDWEEKFLNTCVWLGELAEEYDRGPGRRTLVGLLAEWILSVEEEFSVADAREKKRKKDRKEVSARGRARSHRGKNPYYPAPIDLLGVWRAVVVIVARIQWWRCQVEVRMTDLPNVKVVSTASKRPRSLKPKGTDFLQELRPLFESLRTQGFNPKITLDDIMAWKGWEKIYQRGCSTLSTEITSMLFGVKPTTVRRDLNAGVLRAEYRRHGVPVELQDIRQQPAEVRAGIIRERGWYLRKPIIVEEVYPGHLFCAPPPPSR